MDTSKQIKDLLIDLAISSKIPSDMNELDEHIFDKIINTEKTLPSRKTNLDRFFIEKVAELFKDKRSDIVDICNTYLNTGKLPTIENIDCRFIQARIPKNTTRIEYDTLTKTLSKHNYDSQWIDCIEHVYTND
jgi:hypothetical protein